MSNIPPSYTPLVPPKDLGGDPSVYSSYRMATEPPPHRNGRFRNSLDWYSIVVFIVGGLGIVGVGVILGLIWQESFTAIDGGKPFKIWSDIVYSGWVIRVVTISSVILRIIIAAQAGIVTSMIASLVLERGGIPMHDAPRVSIIRALSPGPQVLLGLVRHRVFPYSILIVLVAATTLASQFISTILLSDFGSLNIAGVSNTSEVAYGMAYPSVDDTRRTIEPYHGINYWRARPIAYHRFAEYHEEPPAAVPGVQDTGLTYRAFLPFGSATQRASLRNYSGPATVVNARTVCLAPTLSNVTISNIGIWDQIVVGGTIQIPATGPSLHGDPDREFYPSPINCSIATPWQRNDLPLRGWSTSICHQGSRQSGPDMDTMQGERFRDYTNIYLVWNTTGFINPDEMARDGSVVISSAAWDDWGEETVDSWNVRTSPDGRNSVAVSACFLNPLPWNYMVDIHAGEGDLMDHPEPVLGWINDTATFDSVAVRRLLGATSLEGETAALPDRGILALEPEANWTRATLEWSRGRARTLNFVWRAALGGLTASVATRDGQDPFQLLTFDVADEASTIKMAHWSYTAVFQDVIQNTGSPALAIQALFTMLMQASYYDMLPYFDTAFPGTVVTSVGVFVPTRWLGFAAVVGILGLHLVLLLGLAVMFVLGTQGSVLWSSWAAVAQVVSEDTREVLGVAGSMRDREVEKWGKERDWGGGAIQLRKRERWELVRKLE